MLNCNLLSHRVTSKICDYTEDLMPNKPLLFLADSVLFLHILVVVFVVLGLVAILVGGFTKWSWVKNPWLRLAHLTCIGVVVLQAWAGVVCPLTTLEMWLREQAGETIYAGSFISHWMEKLLYYDLPAWAFTVIYTAFGCLVAGTWFWVKPRGFRAAKVRDAEALL